MTKFASGHAALATILFDGGRRAKGPVVATRGGAGAPCPRVRVPPRSLLKSNTCRERSAGLVGAMGGYGNICANRLGIEHQS